MTTATTIRTISSLRQQESLCVVEHVLEEISAPERRQHLLSAVKCVLEEMSARERRQHLLCAVKCVLEEHVRNTFQRDPAGGHILRNRASWITECPYRARHGERTEHCSSLLVVSPLEGVLP